MRKSSDMMPHVENRLRNLSKLIDDYQLHVMDLIQFVCPNMDKETQYGLLTNTFSGVFKKLKKSAYKFPAYILVYSNAVRKLLRHKRTPPQIAASIKTMDRNVNIEDFSHKDFSDVDISELLLTIPPKDRIVLCLYERHKIPVEEIATLFSTTSGTISTIISKSKKELARNIILSSGKHRGSSSTRSEEPKECFFVKNNIEKKEYADKNQKHISKCITCGNFYGWMHKINELITDIPRPAMGKNINSYMLSHLNKISLHNKIIKIATAILLLIIVASLLIQHYVPKTPTIEKYVERKEAAVQQKSEQKLTYKIRIFTPNQKKWSETNNMIKQILVSYNAQKAANVELGKESQAGSYYHFLILKKDLTALMGDINTVGKIELNEEAETTEVTPDEVRFEIWVKKNAR
ncbi:MAG: sigma-70 family RNA polymerase sigma factor [Pseudomonadota bacterium]